MKLLKKYIKLQFLELRKFVFVMFIANLFIQAELIGLTRLINHKVINADNLYHLTIAFYAAAFISLFLVTLLLTVNSGGLLFFRASRKILHQTSIIFLLVLSVIFSIIHTFLVFIYGLIFKGIHSISSNSINYIYNYKAMSVISQFIIAALIFFIAALALYLVSMLIQSFGFKAFIVAILFLVMLYKFSIFFGLFKLIEGSSVFILGLVLLALAALLTYLDWIAVKKLNINY